MTCTTALRSAGRILVLTWIGAALATIGLSRNSIADEIRFDRDIKPILSDKCFHCHGPDEENRGADLRLDLEEAAKEYAIVEHDASESELVARIDASDPDVLMPPPESGKTLSTKEKLLLKRWIDSGASWSKHWSFVAPARPPVPDAAAFPKNDVSHQVVQNPIDAFVRSTLRDKGLATAPRASKEELLRRVTLDLTGLPPTPEELDAFLSDESPSAYERVVDRLLASPHYGERMAVMWLDAARYGDTSVYHADGPRDMWGWRDTIVEAYNSNMPFDQFSIAQLAGDLLPDASLQQKVLSGFNRNNGTTDEGGAIAEEYRVEYAVDRVKTTATTWLGLTMECAQCHDHKYDPISQKEYYQFYAFFNVSADGGMQTRNGNAAPVLEIPDPDKQMQIPGVEQQLTTCLASIDRIRGESDEAFQAWLKTVSDNTTAASPGPYWSASFDEGKGKKVAALIRPSHAQTVDLPGTSDSLNQRTAPEKELPEEGATNEEESEEEAIEAKAPEAKAPEAKAPEAKAPEEKAPEEKAPEEKAPEEEAPEEKAPEEEPSEHHAAELLESIAGTIKGPAKWADSQSGKGLEFSGKTFVDFGDIGDFERDQAFSLSAWVKPTGGVGAAIARMDDANGFRGYDLYAGASSVSMHIINTWPSNAIKVTTKKKLPKGKWSHIVATYDGSSKASGINIYINGQQWEWAIEQDGLSGSIRTEKSLLVGSRHPGSRFSGVIDQASIFDSELSAAQVQQLASPIRHLLSLPAEERSEEQSKQLLDHFLRENNHDFADLEKTLSHHQKKLSELRKPLTTVMVMGDQAKPRDTFILTRGAYDSPSDVKVSAATPAALPPISPDLPTNRLGLAKWLFQDDNPLVARVAVNRYWQMLFGKGIVVTPADFGAQGSFPTHPELLDWLAVEFRESGWNVKRLLKLMVMSATYQQTSATGSSSYNDDPENTWLSRGSRFRLPAEFVRDSVLYAADILNLKVGGPGVKPYQPPGLWVEVGLSGKPAFVQDHGDKLYRRSLYTYWKRSAPPPSLQIFDAPTREKCTLTRARTNTPLQALVLMNDIQYIEAARCLADRVTSVCEDDDERIKLIMRLTTTRTPSVHEARVLHNLLQQQRNAFKADEQAAKELLAIGELPLREDVDAVELAAWTIVSSAAINLDDAVTR